MEKFEIQRLDDRTKDGKIEKQKTYTYFNYQSKNFLNLVALALLWTPISEDLKVGSIWMDLFESSIRGLPYAADLT